MGLSKKQVSGDQGVEWGQPFVQSTAATRRQQPQPQAECPRCASTNTKFCYYNNYNKSQPRHFCKSCKRHWTKGGTLRNVPVGGGRKNKRPKPSKSSAAAAPPPAQKNMSNILYHALIGRSSSPLPHETKPIDNISSSPFAAIPNTEFHFSTFDVNPTNSYQPLNAFDHFAVESTITTVNIPGSSSGAMDLPNYWSWNDIDVLTSGDLSLSWDDEDKAVIKP